MTQGSTRKPRKSRKLDEEKVVQLREQGLTITDIAQHQEVNPSTVWRFLEAVKPHEQALARYQQDRGNVFTLVHAETIDAQRLAIRRLRDDLEDDALMAATKPTVKAGIVRDLAVSAGVTYDKERLERGQSTDNIETISKLIGLSDEKLFPSQNHNVLSTSRHPQAEPTPAPLPAVSTS